MIGDVNAKLQHGGKKIVSFCKHTSVFKVNLIAVSRSLPEFGLSFEINQDFRGCFIRSEKMKSYNTPHT